MRRALGSVRLLVFSFLWLMFESSIDLRRLSIILKNFSLGQV